MKIDKPGRDTLKSYFVKNAVPSASNFEDLIGGALNQRDDGIAKLAGEPLSVQADGDDTSQKKLFNFYRNFADPQPAWTLSLAPRVNAADPSSARAGLAIGNGTGATSLFFEQLTGRIGVKTLKPMRDLHIEGSEFHSGGGSAGLSFSNRDSNSGAFVEQPTAGERWVLYSQGGVARLWSGSDKLSINTAGDLALTGTLKAQRGLAVTGGALVPSTGSGQADTNSGIAFVGPTDAAWMRYYSRGGESMTLEIGTADNNDDHIALMPSGCLGIGLTTPTHKFHVKADSAVGLFESSSDQAYLRLWAAAGPDYRVELCCRPAGRLALWTAGAGDVLNITRDGNVGIGTLTPAAKLDVAGPIYAGTSDIYFTNTTHNHTAWGNQAGWAAIENGASHNALMILGRSTAQANVLPNGGGRRVEVWDYMRVNGIFVNNSDATQKRDITRLEYGLDAVRKLRPVSFNWNDVAMPHKTIGLIAQEVRPVIGEVVYDDAIDEKSRLSIAYTNLIPVLINAIQELADRLDALSPSAASPAVA